MSRVVWSAFGLLLGGIALLLLTSPAHAVVTPRVVMSLVQTGDSLSANNEVIEIYNNDNSPVEVSNWCLYYASATTTSNGIKLACIEPTDTLDHVFIGPQATVSFASKQYTSMTPNVTFSATLSGTAGHIRLLDSTGTVVDKIGWGTAVSPEGLPALAPPTDKVLVRTLVNGQFTDTNNNAADFTLAAKPVSVPNHQLYDEEDLCANIDGIQLSLPTDMVVDSSGICAVPVTDLCPNILGIQTTVPDEYEARDDGLCWLMLPSLKINEVFPNPSGSDTGNEYIELYNPTDQAINLANAVLKIGQRLETTVKFTHGETVPASGYFVIQNNTYTFSLLNSSDLVTLQTLDAQTIDQIAPYANPNDGNAWALIDGMWQYTNQPTPGTVNLLFLDSVDPDTVVAGVALAPCAANQYRNPETGRCKLLAEQGSTLVPCKSDQVRNPDTGRCRAVATIVRPVPCPAGQERNADTGRCRKIIMSTPPPANYPVVGSSSSRGNYVIWAVLGVLGLGLGYAIWEWREEIIKLWQRTRRFMRFLK